MSYTDIANMHDSPSLRRRLVACAAQETKPVPQNWVETRLWQIVGKDYAWGEAWAYAVGIGIPDPGADQGVIPDAMILSVIQPMG